MARAIGVLALLSGVAGSATATELGDAPLPYPVQLPYFGVETGALRSHVDFYATMASTGPAAMDQAGNPISLNTTVLVFDAQYAIANTWEIGLTVPFLSSVGEKTEIGNLMVNMKFRLAGVFRRDLNFSLYVNGIVPTASGGSAVSGGLSTGLAMSAGLGDRFFLSGAVGTWLLFGGSKAPTVVTADWFFAASLSRLFNLQLGMPIWFPVGGSTGASLSTATWLAPALQFFPLPGLHVDLGVRVALNDSAQQLGLGGRTAVTFGAGIVY